MKREKLNLGEKVAVICEGGAETAIMEILLEEGRYKCHYCPGDRNVDHS